MHDSYLRETTDLHPGSDVAATTDADGEILGAIAEHHLTGLLITFAIFVTGLVVNTVVASKLVALGPLIVPGSVFVWALTYPIVDIVTEVYGPIIARKLVWSGFCGLIAMFLFFWLSVLMPPAPFWHGQEQFARYFATSTRVIVACLTSYVSTQFLDVFVFTQIRHATNNRHLWIRTVGSTLVAQTLANIIFTVIVFAGVLPWSDWLKLFWGNLAMRYLLIISDTAIVYIGVYILYKAYLQLQGEK